MKYVLIEMNDYSYPKGVSVWHTWNEAVCAARSLIRSRGQIETLLNENADWIREGNSVTHIATRGTETRDAYLIMRAD